MLLYNNRTGCITSCIDNNIVLLDKLSLVNIISQDGNKYVLNGMTSYNSDLKYSLDNGEYKLLNIPTNHPLAITDTNNMISYTGDEDKKLTMGDVSYYYGDITITVNGNFNTASIKCYHHGYMGGQNVLVYS